MQYYYECLEVYEKLVPEVKKHCKILRKYDAKFLVVRESYLEALSEFEEKKEHMTPQAFIQNKKVIDKGNDTLTRLANEKWKTANSLMVTVEYHLSRINGYVREFKCEIDSDSPGTSIEIEKKFLEANRKRVKEIQDLRDEYPFLDDLFKIPEAEPETSEPVNEPMIEPIRINGHRQNIAVLLQDIGSSFRDDDSTMLTLPEPSPSSNSVSPMEVSPGPHGNLSFSYSENNILQNSFSTMPSFSGSQESRHGRQRKFTQKAQQMFKENKLGPGRPSNHFPSMGIPEQINSSSQIPQFNTSSNNHHGSISQLKAETPHPIASSSYSFPQDYSRLPQQQTSQQQYTLPSMYINSHPANTSQLPLQQQQHQHQHQNATFISQQQQQHHQPQPQQQPQQQAYSRPGQQQVRPPTAPNGNNIDGQGEDEEDDREWCFCGEHSYGDMIACENDDCLYKWFHYGCLGITVPPKGSFYCPECQKNLGISRS
uniref:PHD-type domain-containing protein n=1 Tax=Panagrolaimus sp. ES5 TaxID=591445 RepID=A0AC34GQD4_9BILA